MNLTLKSAIVFPNRTIDTFLVVWRADDAIGDHGTFRLICLDKVADFFLNSEITIHAFPSPPSKLYRLLASLLNNAYHHLCGRLIIRPVVSYRSHR